MVNYGGHRHNSRTALTTYLCPAKMSFGSVPIAIVFHAPTLETPAPCAFGFSSA